MSEPTREAVRAALADMVEEAPDPEPFERLTDHDRRPRWTRPALAVAVIVMVVGAMLVFGEEWTGIDVAGPGETSGEALSSRYVLPSDPPTGLEFVTGTQPFPLAGTTLLYMAEGETEWTASDPAMHISIRQPFMGDLDLSTERLVKRLAGLSTTAVVTETSVRGQRAFLVETDATEEDRWTAGVLVVEADRFLTEVRGRGVTAAELVSTAQSLEVVPSEEFEEAMSERTWWDLTMNVSAEDPAAPTETVSDVDGVEAVRSSVATPSSSPLVNRVMRSDDPQVVTTMVPNGAEPTAPPQPVDSVSVRLFVTISPDAALGDVADELTELDQGLRYSPPRAIERRDRFLTRIRDDATVISEAPEVLQAAPGSEPRFDTSDLGTEQPLAPHSEDPLTDEELRWVLERHDSVGMGPIGSGPTAPATEIVNVGASPDGTHVVLSFTDGPWFYDSTVTSSGGGGGIGSFTGSFSYGIGGRSTGPEDSLVEVQVPLETSVVVFDMEGETVWQRPYAGRGLFVFDRVLEGQATVVALDADGETIGEWSRLLDAP